MDRRQLLFGATALGLVANLNLNHPLIAQVGNATMGNRRLSDRERAGLRVAEGDWFLCPSCDHATIPSYPSYLCSCQQCDRLRPPPKFIL